ncbi:hypothetical protein K1Y72_25935 [Actinomadura sp. PM05-2]|uniref:HpcH/HpaI aldolase/citrate lyase domain-containing protein n=1 Tax=Actinomadura parmotrematis TaxID=2864039 RepID=A0ABS7G0C9_9ACTN|nr:hypothetical protein [Actinomadura parmotrematis]
MAPVLAGLVDDAGLFPPTALPMDAALARHRRDLAAAHPMLTHRFLCPASRWDELAGRLRPGEERLRVGVILDGVLPPLESDRHVVELVEVPLGMGGRAAVAAVLQRTADVPVPVFVEPVRGPDQVAAIGQIAEWRERDAAAPRGAKVRCGGLRAGAFPAGTELAAFVTACAGLGVPFKATAGLHRALPYVDAATGFRHHGFLNLVLATARAVQGEGPEEVAKCFAEGADVPAALAALPADVAERTRALLVSYGSCSTDEPVEQVARYGLAKGAL